MVAMAVIATSTYAQSAATDEGKRKVKSKNSPAYPELARRMNVSGKVKIEVIVMPDGRVRSTRVIGGHPLLVQACQDAVKNGNSFQPLKRRLRSSSSIFTATIERTVRGYNFFG